MYMHYLILCRAHCIIQIVCSVLYGDYDVYTFFDGIQYGELWLWNLDDHCLVRTETGINSETNICFQFSP